MRPSRAVALLLCAACASAVPSAAEAQERPRLLVLTDIGGDPDDMQSMRRLLLYANEFEIVGLVASASGIVGELGRSVTRPDLIHEIVDDYGEDLPHLALHAAGYPTAAALHAVVASGSPRRGVPNVGTGRSTEGSRLIVAAVDAAERPLHVAVWGGAHDLAQALHDVRESRTPSRLAFFLAKLRVYAIGDQDAPRLEGVEASGQGTGEWIRTGFPALRYLQAGPPGESPFLALFRGMYQNDSRGGGGAPVPLVPEGVAALNQAPWVGRNVREAHGALGEGYPLAPQNPASPNNLTGVKEGDTPSWFFVLPNGLSDPEHPEWGGWGGRFRLVAGGFFTDAEDDHWTGTTDVGARRKWTVARWREAYQNELAARMDWTTRPFDWANHNPAAVVNGVGGRRVMELTAAPGERLVLDARGSTDPDGDRLSYRWWLYREPSRYRGQGIIEDDSTAVATVSIPPAASGTALHVVLEVTDDGDPRLTSYRRVVVRIP